MKSILVQIEERKSGVKVTAWYQDFDYAESCSHVYVTKKVFRNGSKSTIPAFAKAVEKYSKLSFAKSFRSIPAIFTVNTYFWTPASTARERRNMEAKRREELREFMVDNLNYATEKLKSLLSGFLQEEETILVDQQGAYLAKGKEKYYFYDNFINKESIELARVKIQKREQAL